MKKFLMVLCCVLSFGFVLAGCSTVSMIKNENNEVIYNGSASVSVGDYLYYGNAFNEVSSLTSKSELNALKSSSYLARLDTSNISAKGQNFTPNEVKKVTSEVVGQENQFIFVLGDYLYFLKPDTHVYVTDGTGSNQFGYSVLTSVKLNGDKVREICTYEGAISQIEVLKNGDNYYVIAFAGDKLFSTKLNNGKGSTKVLGEGVTSVAVPETYSMALAGYSSDWNGKIYYTATDDEGVSSVKEVAVDAKSAEDAVNVGDKNGTVTFLHRQNDLIFYTYSNGTTTKTYYNRVDNLTGEFYTNDIILIDAKNKFSNSEISNIYVFGEPKAETIVYTMNSKIYYKNFVNGGGSGRVNITDGSADVSATIMTIDGRMAYLISSTAIYGVDFAKLTYLDGDQDLTANILAEMTSISTTLYSYDGEYVYFYAGLEALTDEEKELIADEKEEAGIESDDEEEEEDITSLDDGVYLYRVSISGNDLQLLGVTEYEERHSNYVYKK